MTPFDPTALLAVLLTFYPIVGPAAFARARLERPEYFAGGEIIGRHGDALRLPDGRVWDFIFDVLGPDMRWIAIDVSPGAGGAAADDPFQLEEGPLTPIDESAFVLAPFAPVFEPLVAGALDELVNTDRVLDDAAGGVTNGPSPAEVDTLLGDPTSEAEGVLGNALAGAADLAPADVVAASEGQSRQTPGNEGLYDEPTPHTLPAPPDGPIKPPGPITRDELDEGRPDREPIPENQPGGSGPPPALPPAPEPPPPPAGRPSRDE